MPSELRTAIVSGANRGLGFETCRRLAQLGYRVVLTSRDPDKGRPAAASLDVDYHPLDVADAASADRLAAYVRESHGRADVLVNNAAILRNDADARGLTAIDPAAVQEVFDTNLLGVLRLTQAFIPLMKQQGHGRIVNVSSGLGQHAYMGKGWPSYRISKAALNAATQILAAEVAGTGILVNSVCPGWVRTDMGGPEANLSVEEGAQSIVWAATLPDNGPTGGFFRHGKPIPW